MHTSLHPHASGIGCAISIGAIYLACVILYLIMPQQLITLAQYMFHGIDITKISGSSMSFGSVILGFIEVLILSYIVGWLYVIVYNKVIQQK